MIYIFELFLNCNHEFIYLFSKYQNGNENNNIFFVEIKGGVKVGLINPYMGWPLVFLQNNLFETIDVDSQQIIL
jgi:hypothetical protein